jgi:hypothetical protein
MVKAARRQVGPEPDPDGARIPNSSIYSHYVCTASHILNLVSKCSPFVGKPNDVRIIELCIIDLSIFVDEYSARMPRRGIRHLQYSRIQPWGA